MSEENNNAAPVIQDYKFSNIDDCVKYLNEDETINKELNEYLRNQLSSGIYRVTRCDDNFRYFKPYLIYQFLNERKIMKLKFNQNNNELCQKFDAVILDFDTVHTVIKACCEKRTAAFIVSKTSVLSFINEKDKDKKISCQHCVEFIGRFHKYGFCKPLDTSFINKILEITDVSSKKVDKSKNVYCIQDAIDALPDECFSMPKISELLNLIFSVQDFSLFSSNPRVLYGTIYALIIKSEKYIKGDQVGAIRDVLENGGLYKEFREELKKVNINFDMQMLIEGSSDLTMLLYANNLAVTAKNGKITIEERKPTPGKLMCLLRKQSSYLNVWITGVTGTKSYGLHNENIDKNQFKIDSFEKLQNVKVKLIKSYIEHSSKSEILKKAFKPLLDLEESRPEEFNKLLNKIKLSDEAIKSVFQAIKLKDKLTGEQFDDFKKTIGDLCFGVDKPLFSDIDLLRKFCEKTLTSVQMEELLNLSEQEVQKRIVIKTGDVLLPVAINRLKDEEVLSEDLLKYFYSSFESHTGAKKKNSVSCFCRTIGETILHSLEYITSKGDEKAAIEAVLSNGKKYEPFRKCISNLVTDSIKFIDGAAKINLDDIYKEENHTVKKEGQKPEDTIVKKLVDLLDRNHFKLTFDNQKCKLKLESTRKKERKRKRKRKRTKQQHLISTTNTTT